MHRLAIAAFPLLVVAAACAALRTSSGTPPADSPARDDPASAAIERDLVLELALANAGPFSPAHPPELRWTIRNTSATERHAVVQGGDGCESGWREPVFSLTAEMLGADGEWSAVRCGPYGRCGLYDPEWRDEVVCLAPGESLVLEWVPWPQIVSDLSEVSRLRFRAEYRFTRGEAGKGMGREPIRGSAGAGAPDPGIPAFTLVSAPLEVRLR